MSQRDGLALDCIGASIIWRVCVSGSRLRSLPYTSWVIPCFPATPSKDSKGNLLFSNSEYKERLDAMVERITKTSDEFGVPPWDLIFDALDTFLDDWVGLEERYETESKWAR